MAFDFDTYLADVAKLQSGLAELYGIDAVLKYLNDLVHQELESPGHAEVGGIPEGITFRLGTTHPFDYSLVVDGWDDDRKSGQIVDHMNQLLASGAAAVASDLATFSSTVNDIVMPTSTTLEQLALDLNNQINAPLTTLVSADFGELEHSLSDWRGQAADEFADMFYNQFAQMAQNQAWLAACLGVLVSGVKGIVDLAQNSLQNMVTSMLKGVDEQLQQRHDAHQSTGFSLGHFLALAALATGLLALIEFPEAAAAAGPALEATSQSLHYAESSVPERDAEQHEIKAASAHDFLEQLSTSARRIVQNYHSNLDALNTQKVTPLQRNVHEIIDRKLLYPPPLAITDGPLRSGDFYNQA